MFAFATLLFIHKHMASMRLQKFIALSGLCSRRKAETLITSGRVQVNGETITKLGTKVDPEVDVVRVDGRTLSLPEKNIYIAFHKPPGLLTTVKDPFGRPTVLEFLKETGQIPGDVRIYHVGRLDRDSEGLLILTNDGELTHALLHPSMKVEKEYIVTVKGIPKNSDIKRLKEGILLHGKMTRPCSIEILKKGAGRSTINIRLKEGRKRQIRYMFKYIGHPVLRLIRTRIGPIGLGSLPRGRSRPLSTREVLALKKAVSCKAHSPSSCR